jgi:hypothetical protein
MKIYSTNDILDLLEQINLSTRKLKAISLLVNDQDGMAALSELNNRAALYLIDCSALLQEDTPEQGDELSAFMSLAEQFCAQIEALRDPDKH